MKRYEGLVGPARTHEFTLDLWKWAGERKVYWLVDETRLKAFKNSLPPGWPDRFVVVATIQLPKAAPPDRRDGPGGGPGGPMGPPGPPDGQPPPPPDDGPGPPDGPPPPDGRFAPPKVSQPPPSGAFREQTQPRAAVPQDRFAAPVQDRRYRGAAGGVPPPVARPGQRPGPGPGPGGFGALLTGGKLVLVEWIAK